MKNHWEILPKLCKWKRSLGHQAMTFALAPLTVIGPAWRSWLISKPFTGLFRFNRTTKYPTKLGEWPSGHTNLPCPCFKSSCQKWHRHMTWGENGLKDTYTSDTRCFETSGPSATFVQHSILVLALVHQHTLLSVPHLEKQPMTNCFVLAGTFFKKNSSQASKAILPVPEKRPFWNCPGSLNVFRGSSVQTQCSLGSSQFIHLRAFIDTSIAPSLPSLTILGIGLPGECDIWTCKMVQGNPNKHHGLSWSSVWRRRPHTFETPHFFADCRL